MLSDMDHFTPRARRVLVLAQAEAERLRHPQVGTEHLLLALVREKDGLAGRVLRDMGLAPDRVELVLQGFVRASGPFPRQPDLSSNNRRVLELATGEAQRIGAKLVDTEHLLLGLLRHPTAGGQTVLRQLGLQPEMVRVEMERAIGVGRTVLEKSSKAGQEDRSSPTDSEGDGQLRRSHGSEPASSSQPDQYLTDLTAMATAGDLDPVIGREAEIERLIEILCRRTKNNPALIGDPGVGKTAIVYGLAQQLADGRVPGMLQGRPILMLDISGLVAGTAFRGEFEARLKVLLREVRRRQAILFVDELHLLVGAGASGDNLDAANLLKPALARGEIRCVGCTTTDEYRKRILANPALERRFQPILIEEPDQDQAVEILRGLRARYEEHHDLKITDEALETAVQLSARYIPDRRLPDKAVDLIDETAAHVRLRHEAPDTARLATARRELKMVESTLDEAFRSGRYAEATELARKRAILHMALKRLDGKSRPTPNVVPADIALTVASWTGIPVARIDASSGDEARRLMQLEDELGSRIIGQEEALSALARAVRRGRAGMKDLRRPLGSFLFLGPTGVGKTAVTRALAEILFGSEDARIHLDMSEFSEAHTAARLVGAPPGYIGHDEAGQLTEAIRRRPYSVIVFDEVEKAHSSVLNLLLQILEEGQLTDGHGRRADFRNAIVILTSNAGARYGRSRRLLGFGPGERGADDESTRAGSRAAMTRPEGLQPAASANRRAADESFDVIDFFRPELINRLDEVIHFHRLNSEDIERITELELGRVRTRLVERGISLQTTPEAISWLAKAGYNEEFGARPLRRVIQRQVEDRLSEALIQGQVREGDTVLLDLADGTISVRVPAPALATVVV